MSPTTEPMAASPSPLRRSYDLKNVTLTGP